MKKRAVLVTGASKGIGAASAVAFAKKGYFVCVNYLNDLHGAEATLEEVKKFSDGMLCRCDVSEFDSVLNMRDTILSVTEEVDTLVNNAGIGLFGVFHKLEHEKVKRMYDVNLFGTLNCTRAFLPGMINAKRGCVINVTSVGGERGLSCEADYSASKAAVIGLTKALAKETGPSGVRVNCVSPGFIDTDMNGRLSYLDVQSIVDEIPMERTGEPEDVAEAVVFLASDSASYVTGHILTVDGGWFV